MKLSRRHLLQGVGLGGLSALPLLSSRRLRAQQSSAPLRFLVVYSPNGTIWSEWASAGASETDYTTGRILAPLEAFKSRIITMEGVNQTIASETQGIPSFHARSIGGLLTGQRINFGTFMAAGNTTNAGWANGISLDQYLANQIEGQTPFKSLEFGVMVTDDEVRGRLSYLGPDQPLPPMNSPYDAFDRVFAGVGPGVDQGALDQLRADRRSVLDVVLEEIDDVRPRLPSEDQLKLDAHLDSLRGIEQRLAEGSLGNLGQTCTVPTLGERMDALATDNMPTTSELQMDLIAASLACDTTRIATLQFSWAESNQQFPWLDLPSGNIQHHNTSHAGDSDADAQESLVRVNTWYNEQFAYLLQKLDSYQENGSTLLDNTIILRVNELARGNDHQLTDLPFLLAGGQNAGLVGGRHLDFSGSPRRHNDLLVSIANLMGDEINVFGDVDYSNGALPGLG